MSTSLNAWFKREILAHQDALNAYLFVRWRRPGTADLRQDVYLRVYEAARIERPALPMHFLIATARNLIVDRWRRTKGVSFENIAYPEEFDDLGLEVLLDEISPERNVEGRQQLERLVQAFHRLPPKCAEATWLIRVDCLRYHTVATRLGIGVTMVEKHVYKGMRRLTEIMAAENSLEGLRAVAAEDSAPDPCTH